MATRRCVRSTNPSDVKARPGLEAPPQARLLTYDPLAFCERNNNRKRCLRWRGKILRGLADNHLGALQFEGASNGDHGDAESLEMGAEFSLLDEVLLFWLSSAELDRPVRIELTLSDVNCCQIAGINGDGCRQPE
jgi:hypothetical protein